MAMIKKLLFTLSLCMMVVSVLYAQSTIKGVIKGLDNSGIPYLQILLKQDGKVVNGAYTDDLGNYQIFGVAAGTYDITAGGTMTCLSTHTEKGIYVSSSEVKFVDIVMNCSSTELEEVEIQYVPPIFSQDNTTSSSKLTGEEVRKTPGRSITAALSNLEGVASVDGEMKSVRGNRSDGQQTIIDGVRVRGSGNVTMQSVEGAELIQGGIPAEYGDGTSFTIITTRGVSKDFHGGVELRSSLEGYGQTLAAASVSGPLLKGRTAQDPARMGFLLSAEGTYDMDASPAQGGTWVAKPEVIENIIKKPIDYRILSNNFTSYYLANDLESDAFKKIRVRQNASDWGFLVQGKIDIMGGGKDARGKAKNNLRFSIGGSYQYSNALQWGEWKDRYFLFNSNKNGVKVDNTLRLNARLNHRVKTDTAANAILKNVMYDINVNYTLVNQKYEDRVHKNNLFAYGYIGKFTTSRRDYYDFKERRVAINPNDTITAYVLELDNYQAVDWVSFNKDGWTNGGNYYNPDLIPYTQNFIDDLIIGQGKVADIFNPTEEERYRVAQLLGGFLTNPLYNQYGALLNGDIPNNIAYGLYVSPGVNTSGYSIAKQEALGAKLSLSLNIQDHEIKFGFDFEKLTSRSFAADPVRLWGLMRQLTTDQSIFQLNLESPSWASGNLYPNYGINDLGEFVILDTLMYDIIPNLSYFDQQLRAKRKINSDLVYLDVDSYDPNELNTYGLGLFSNYELLNGGNNLVSYGGFDYTGSPSNKKLDLNKFFSGGDLYEKDKYAIGAFEPIYLAFYLQDKFSISNLLFNVGLRVDYFNANQYVLKDPFLLRDAESVKDLKNASAWEGFKFPDNVEDNWIPYVSVADNDANSAPHAIVAYRNDKTWYNSYGQEVADPTTYLGAGGPVLKNKPLPGDPSKASSDAFQQYRPLPTVMPRISFSFPVSTNSLFYAHYNIITYRPTNLQVNPIAYLFIDRYQTSTRIISNPDLKAQRSVDYEIGFRQKVGENAALNFTAYYSEKRDQIQSYRYTGAYPNTYYSYANQDFGTVQGFMLGISMRGAKNLTFRASYTLSFAKGTGSSAGSNLAIIASGQPNLRTLTNLSFDQRHKISGSIDLRFDQGTNYNGPKTIKQKKGTETVKEIRWLENAGITLLVSGASGMPYSRSGIVYSFLKWGEQTNPRLKGSINGATMPWIFQCDLRIDKSFTFNLAGKNDKNESGKRKNKPGMLTVYLDFQNLLNIKNVQDVYDYTGSAVDDGYLSSALFTSVISSGTAFTMPVSSARNYYEMAIANPFNYTQPFRVYLGLMFSF